MTGYVSLALELNLINAFYKLTQGPYDLQPTLHATFKPAQPITRAEFAVIITRTFPHWEAVTVPAAQARLAAYDELTTAEATAYPNPCQGSTIIRFTVPQAGHVSVDVQNLIGGKVQTLVDESKPAGSHQVPFNGSNLPSGVYLFTVKTGTTTSSKRLVIQ